MSFDAKDKRVYDVLNRNIYQIPRNQRKYVWTKRNWEELFEDVSLVADKSFQNHFIGSIVLKNEGRHSGLPRYTIIDGQQRIITITIFLASILYWFKKLNYKDDFEGCKQYLIAKDDKAHECTMIASENYMLLKELIFYIDSCDTAEIENKSLKAFVEMRPSYQVCKSIGDAFKYFGNRIEANLQEYLYKEEYLVALRDAIVEMTLVEIVSSTDEDSYTIFEILNARGTDLEDYELLKNYIMRYITPESNRDEAKIKWGNIEELLGGNISRFIKHYTIHKFGYDKGLSDYKQIQNGTRKNETSKLLDDLMVKARLYLKYVDPIIGKCGNCNEIEYKVFSFFKKKKYWQMRPVLLSLTSKMEADELAYDKYNEVITYLLQFYICYNIIGEENSNKLTNCINKYAVKIENDFSCEAVDNFINELKSKMPTYESFVNSFRTIGWTHSEGFYEGEKNKNRVKTVLETLERYKNNGVWQDEMTIEHIWDDAAGKENAIIGNIIPLEKTLNRQCIGKSFNEKIEIYKESNYKLARNFAKVYKDKEFKPKERTDYMAKEFYKDILQIN